MKFHNISEVMGTHNDASSIGSERAHAIQIYYHIAWEELFRAIIACYLGKPAVTVLKTNISFSTWDDLSYNREDANLSIRSNRRSMKDTNAAFSCPSVLTGLSSTTDQKLPERFKRLAQNVFLEPLRCHNGISATSLRRIC